MRIELTQSAWKAEVLPLNYTCIYINSILSKVCTLSILLVSLEKNKILNGFLSPAKKMEQVKGIEPSQSAWKAEVLPLNYTCIFIQHRYIITNEVSSQYDYLFFLQFFYCS